MAQRFTGDRSFSITKYSTYIRLNLTSLCKVAEPMRGIGRDYLHVLQLQLKRRSEQISEMRTQVKIKQIRKNVHS